MNPPSSAETRVRVIPRIAVTGPQAAGEPGRGKAAMAARHPIRQLAKAGKAGKGQARGRQGAGKAAGRLAGRLAGRPHLLCVLAPWPSYTERLNGRALPQPCGQETSRGAGCSSPTPPISIRRVGLPRVASSAHRKRQCIMASAQDSASEFRTPDSRELAAS